MIFPKFILTLYLGLLSCFCLGQGFDRDSQMILAENLYNEKNYKSALDIYLDMESQSMGLPYLKYRIGLCYYHSLEKSTAIEYLETALKHRDETVPPEVYYYLGRLHHLNYSFDKAIDFFNKYKTDKENQNLIFLDTDRLIQMCRNGRKITNMPVKDLEVSIAKPPLNSSYNDYAPLIRPNGGALFIGSNRPTESVDLVFPEYKIFYPKKWELFPEDVFVSYPRGIHWDTPLPQGLKDKKVIPLSLRKGGSEMLLFIRDNEGKGDLYISEYKGSRWVNLKKLDRSINAKYQEIKGACFTENGKAIYFSSNREGGMGGFDLFVSRESENGKSWKKPENLGNTINTRYDEVTPFMYPDESSFYFSSDGHNSMGGFDVFRTNITEEYTWGKPENLGYPVNSTADDLFFVQQTNKKHSFLSSNRVKNASVGNLDIITVFKPDRINPLSMLKGRIIVRRNGEQVFVKLRVTEKATGNPVSHVYNPTLESGDYFVILAPRKVYNIVIEANGGYNYEMEISIPEDTYTYNLNKEIEIESVSLFGDKVGEQALMTSDTSYMTSIDDSRGSRDLKYDALLLFMERAVDAQERERFASLDELDSDLLDPKSAKDPYYTPLIDRMADIFERGDFASLRDLGKPIVISNIRLFGRIIGNQQIVGNYTIPYTKGSVTIPANLEGDFNQLAQLLTKDKDLKMEIIYTEISSAINNERADNIYGYMTGKNRVISSQINQKSNSNSEMEEGISLKIYIEKN
ncbi:MAG: tetratricopeptide (TPR) repeat protein [Flammeovirgaceae bacterium]|jgi:tetratricopeptide (TPR) repeat protein